MDRLTLILLLVSGVIAVLLATRLRRLPLPKPEAPPNVLRVDLDSRDRSSQGR